MIFSRIIKIPSIKPQFLQVFKILSDPLLPTSAINFKLPFIAIFWPKEGPPSGNDKFTLVKPVTNSKENEPKKVSQTKMHDMKPGQRWSVT